jgi:peroxiredoxin Q/BCP
MKSYRDRYDQLEGNATIIAVSADKEDKQAKFRREIGAEFSFVSDARGKLIRTYGVKMPLVTFAKRTTFVISPKGTIAHIDTGKSAMSAGEATTCALSFG